MNKKYEHKVITCAAYQFRNILEEYENQGWEFITWIKVDLQYKVYFRKKIKSKKKSKSDK